MEQQLRIEYDTMSEVEIPASVLWRAQTQRAVENFPVSGRPLESEQIRAMGLLKVACAIINEDRDLLSAEQIDAIVAAAKEIADGRHDDRPPIDVFQTGSGMSSNMNTSEVIASIAKANGAEVHPDDRVNMGQPSNNTFPTATHVAATEAAVKDLIPGSRVLQESLAKKAKEWEIVVKSGHTHLMDVVPVTLGQEFSGYARQAEVDIGRIEATLPRLGELSIGGTAVDTGLSTPADFGARITEQLIELTGAKELKETQNHFGAQTNRDGLVEFPGVIRSVAVPLNKIVNDTRWMGSGPLTGLAEIHPPDLRPGSSITPGRVNPVLCETAIQVAAQVMSNDAAVTFAGTNDAFELNVFIPVMACNILESAKLLANTAHVFVGKLVDGVKPNVECMKTPAESSPSIVTPLNPAIGYENAAKVARAALKEGKTIRQTVIGIGFIDGEKLTEEESDKRLDVLTMASTGRDQFFLNSKV